MWPFVPNENSCCSEALRAPASSIYLWMWLWFSYSRGCLPNSVDASKIVIFPNVTSSIESNLLTVSLCNRRLSCLLWKHVKSLFFDWKVGRGALWTLAVAGWCSTVEFHLAYFIGNIFRMSCYIKKLTLLKLQGLLQQDLPSLECPQDTYYSETSICT